MSNPDDEVEQLIAGLSSSGLEIRGNITLIHSLVVDFLLSCFLYIDALDDESNQWVFLENIYALFSIVSNTPLKNPLNFDMSVTELIRSGNTMELWEDKNWKNPYYSTWPWSDKWEQYLIDMTNIFRLPNTELTLMAISHFYTMNDFIQLGRNDLFTFSNENREPNELALGEIPKSLKTCFKEMYKEFSGSAEETEDSVFGVHENIALSVTPSPCKRFGHRKWRLQHQEAALQWGQVLPGEAASYRRPSRCGFRSQLETELKPGYKRAVSCHQANLSYTCGILPRASPLALDPILASRPLSIGER